MSHCCAIEGCKTVIADELLMCAHHWRLVPTATQRTINTQWRAMRSAKTTKTRLGAIELYRLARQAAVLSVQNSGPLA